MQNSNSDPVKMLDCIQPKTKAARIKAMHSLIEAKIQAGVRIAEIVAVLNEAGLDINEATLKSYLHRLRRERPPALSKKKDANLDVMPASQTLSSTKSTTIQDIDSIINQDPASQANDMANYERLAKSNRRKT